METLVFDSSPLILLSSVGLLEKCQALGKQCLIPLSVYQEVVERGKEFGKDNWLLVTLLVEKRLFEVVPVQGNLPRLPSSLSPADQDALVLAKQKNAVLVMDDEEGRTVASMLGVATVGSLGVVVDLVRKRVITKKSAIMLIDKMIESGLYCSHELYFTILNKLKEL